MIQISSRNFRDKQASVFDLADKGEKIVIRRGKKQAYMLVPIDDNDLELTPEALSRIYKEPNKGTANAMKEAQSGVELETLDVKNLKKYVASL